MLLFQACMYMENLFSYDNYSLFTANKTSCALCKTSISSSVKRQFKSSSHEWFPITKSSFTLDTYKTPPAPTKERKKGWSIKLLLGLDTTFDLWQSFHRTIAGHP